MTDYKVSERPNPVSPTNFIFHKGYGYYSNPNGEYEEEEDKRENIWGEWTGDEIPFHPLDSPYLMPQVGVCVLLYSVKC